MSSGWRAAGLLPAWEWARGRWSPLMVPSHPVSWQEAELTGGGFGKEAELTGGGFGQEAFSTKSKRAGALPPAPVICGETSGLGHLEWDTCLCSFCDLSIFSAVVFDFMFCICIRNHWHFWSTSQALPVASFPACVRLLSLLAVLRWEPLAFGELLGPWAGPDCQETTGSSERTLVQAREAL